MSLFLDANSLLSKWGNGDGGVVDEWYWDTYDEPMPDGVDEADVLESLVRTHLLPLIAAAGHTYELERIETSHNPVRLRYLDGVEVDQYNGPDLLTGIYVDIPDEVALAAVRKPVDSETGGA